MSTRHEWTDPEDGITYWLEPHQEGGLGVESGAHLPLRLADYPPADALGRHVLRLAEREKELEAQLAESEKRVWETSRPLAEHAERAYEKLRAAEERERKLREALLTAIPQAVADRLLTNGGGEVGARLVIEGPAQEDFGGWCRSAVEDATRGVLRALLKEE